MTRILYQYPHYFYRILLIYKESAYSRYFKKKEPKGDVRFLKQLHDQHFCMVEKAIAFLRKEELQVTPLKRAEFLPMRLIHDVDLVITIGGDGTFLDTSHCVKGIPMWGINSTPSHSVGYFMSATPSNFERQWRKLIRGQLPVFLLQRLQVRLNGHPLPELVLNDLLMTHVNPAAISRYELRIGARKEEQRSSGLWIAAAAGSTAAIRSAGGEVLALESKQIQYLARELYHGRRERYHLAKGVCDSKVRIRVVSHMHEAACYLDGPRVSYSMNYGDQVEVQLSPQPLRVVGHPGKKR